MDDYVRTCLVCQQDKVEHKKQGGPKSATTRAGETMGKYIHGLNLSFAQGRWIGVRWWSIDFLSTPRSLPLLPTAQRSKQPGSS